MSHGRAHGVLDQQGFLSSSAPFNMQTGCLLTLLLYAAVVGWFFATFSGAFPPPASWIAPLVAGTVSYFALGGIWTAGVRFRDQGLVRRARRGEPPRPGKRCAALGLVEAAGEPLTAPFSGRPVVAFEYELRKPGGPSDESSTTNAGLGGFRMTKFTVGGGHGRLTVLGYPDLGNEPWRTCRTPDAFRRARAVVNSAEFADLSGIKIVGGWTTIMGVYSDEDGSVSKHWQRSTEARAWLDDPAVLAWMASDEKSAGLADAGLPGERSNRETEADGGEPTDDFSRRPAPRAPVEPSDDDIPGGSLLDEFAAAPRFGDDLPGAAPRAPAEKRPAVSRADGSPSDRLPSGARSEGDAADDDEDERFDDDEAGDSAASTFDLQLLPELAERSVSPGDQVAIFGFYSAERSGLVPSLRRHGEMLRLLRGSPDTVEAGLVRSGWGHLVGGLVTLVIVQVAMAGAGWTARHSPEVRRYHDQEMQAALAANDLTAVAELLERRIDPTQTSTGEVYLVGADDPRTVEVLLRYGADPNLPDRYQVTPLMQAARYGRVDIVKQLIAAGARLDDRRPQNQATALSMAIEEDHPEVVEVLRAAGAHDDSVTSANGRSVTEHPSPAVVAVVEYLAAIHRRDVATLQALSSASSTFDFGDVDWQAWHDCRPLGDVDVTGFANDEAASLVATGRAPAGYPVVWVYSLRVEGGRWRIVREHWRIK